MTSMHELGEARGELGTHFTLGIFPKGKRRLDVLKKERADYLYYRLVWAETRGKVMELLPAAGTPTKGELVSK